MTHQPGLPPSGRAAIAAVAAVTSLSLLAGVLLLFETHSAPEAVPPVLAAGGCDAEGAAVGGPAAAPCTPAARR